MWLLFRKYQQTSSHGKPAGRLGLDADQQERSLSARGQQLKRIAESTSRQASRKSIEVVVSYFSDGKSVMTFYFNLCKLLIVG